MIEEQLVARGIKDKRLLKAFSIVPRHLFVEEGLSANAYGDFALPIGEKQTISQPYIVAYMIEALALKGDEKVLDIGSGSGYQSALLSLLAGRVFCIERLARIATRARKLLDDFHSANVVVRVGDGTVGWSDEAPFDAIIVAAAGPHVPEALLTQLGSGGRLIMPVGGEFENQRLVLVTKKGKTFTEKDLGGCRFVPLLGKNGWHK
ncbi:MAG: protein-L-isoaspartate(D-aspartate) O-methyltransferase [Thermodesulfobacteriota bacterium]